MNDNSSRKIFLILVILIGIYFLFSFLPPIFMKLGYIDAGNMGYRVYELFCHQKPERSLYLFGEKSFYSISELSFENEAHYNEYVGDQLRGYKVAICIRDIALYGTFFLSGLLIVLLNFKKTFQAWVLVLLISPIVIDIGIQMILEFLNDSGKYNWYIDNIPKRILTGILAGKGVALFIFQSLTKGDNKS